MDTKAELAAAEATPAGRLLVVAGFKATHQGGGQINFTRLDSKGRLLVVCGEDGQGPVTEDEAVVYVLEDPSGSTDDEAVVTDGVRAFLRTLS